MTDLKRIAKFIGLLLLMIVANRFTKGYIALAVGLCALGVTLTRRDAMPVLCCIMLSFLNLISEYIIGGKVALMFSVRAYMFLLGPTIALVFARKYGNVRIGLGVLLIYCLYSFLPSSFGYCPRVSYYKLLFFGAFLVAIMTMARMVNNKIELAWKVRDFLLAVCIVLIVGSACTLPFPAIAYPLTTRWLLKDGMDIGAANEMLKATAEDGGMRLFAGITMHSQMLAPILAMVFGFLLLDMLFVEKKISKLHIALILVVGVFAYMTKSRTALLSMAVIVACCLYILSLRSDIPQRLKRHIKGMMVGVVAVAAIGAVALQIKSGFLTTWVYKGQNRGDSVYTAVTNTRLGAIEELTQDFRKNPFLGCGFQVNEESARFKDQAFVFSAPVEKGVLPLVVLGEGGLIGGSLFLGFLFAFYTGCVRQGYLCTLVLFSSLLATNLGEAIFFSPGGTGGLLWLFSVIGGAALDSIPKYQLRHNDWRGLGYANYMA